MFEDETEAIEFSFQLLCDQSSCVHDQHLSKMAQEILFAQFLEKGIFPTADPAMLQRFFSLLSQKTGRNKSFYCLRDLNQLQEMEMRFKEKKHASDQIMTENKPDKIASGDSQANSDSLDETF